ncbi:MAG: EAL domain-containing protein [Hydrogenovibrio sp.]|nr:EAL domain-containing protein [Hydrogenovibrio sp.]
MKSPISRLFGVLFLSLCIAFGIYISLEFEESLDGAKNELRYLNNLFNQSTKNTLIKHESTLKLIGRELISNGALDKPEVGRNLIDSMSHIDQGMAGFGLARTNGQLVLISNVPTGSTLPNLLENDHTHNEFLKTVKKDQLVLGKPYHMKVLDSWVVPLRVRVSGKYAGQRRYGVMAAGYRLKDSNAGWSNLSLASGQKISIIRDDGALLYQNPMGKDLKRLFNKQVSSSLLHKVQSYRPMTGFFYYRDTGGFYLMHYSRLPQYEITTLASLPMKEVLEYFFTRVLLALVLLSVFVFFGWLAFKRIHQEQQQYEENLVYQATHDALTGLPNRKYLKEFLDHKLKYSDPTHVKDHLAVLFLDLDYFKKINDSFGHSIGDLVLKQVANRLRAKVELKDLIARQGGDEFILIYTGFESVLELEQLAEQIIDVITAPMLVENKILTVGTSLGISLYPRDAATSDDLLRNADTALYKAKEDGRSTYAFYSEDLNKVLRRRLDIEEGLATALEDQQIRVAFQPQAEAKTGKIVGVEALMRWHSGSLGMMSPEEFIPIAEDIGIIRDLDNYVMEQAIKSIAHVNAQIGESLHLSINVSAKQLMDSHFPEKLSQAMTRHDFPPSHLNVELTETALLSDFTLAITQLRAVRNLGVGISIDDFGTGFSSLTYLHRLPATEIKVDKSFVMDILADEHDAALTRSIIQMGQGLKLKVVAEGVETAEHLEKLREYGCDLIQGYYLAKPMSEQELMSLLTSRLI